MLANGWARCGRRMAQSLCLIGGAGFIGTALREALAARGDRVVIVGRSHGCATSANEIFLSRADHDADRLAYRLTALGVDTIVDLSHASVPNPRGGPLVDTLAANLTSLTANLDLACAIAARRYLYISSGGTVYGDAGTAPLSERQAPAPISTYGIAKLTGERLVSMYHRSHGLDVVIARPANVYGPGQRPFTGQGIVGTALGSALRGTPVTVFGGGRAVRDFIFRTDCAAGLIAILDRGQAGEIYNLGTGAGVSIAMLIDAIAVLVARDGFVLDRRDAPAAPTEVPYNVLDTDKLCATTGWRPQILLEDGLARSWDWIRTEVAL